MTRIDEQKMKNTEERKNIDDIPARIETINSEHSSTSKCEKYKPKVNSDPDPPPSDSSDSSSLSDSERKRKKSKKNKKRRKLPENYLLQRDQKVWLEQSDEPHELHAR